MGPNDPESLPSSHDVVTTNGDKRAFTATIVLYAARREGLGSDNLVLGGAFYARLKMRMHEVTGGTLRFARGGTSRDGQRAGDC